MADEAPITPELAGRLEKLLDELRATPCTGPEAWNLARRHNLGIIDVGRRAFLVDEAVYAGAQYRSQRWQDLALARAPVPMVLFCPRCGTRHVDQADPANGWLNEPHRSHLCAACGNIWRPADIATVGVAAIGTRGRLDVDQPEREIDWRTVVRRCAERFRENEKNYRRMAHDTMTSPLTPLVLDQAEASREMAELCEALLAPAINKAQAA